MVDFLDMLDDPAIVPAPTQRQALALRRNADLETVASELEAELYQESMRGLRDAMRWHEIDEHAEKPPERWFEEGMTLEEAERAFRVAKAAWKSAKEAPIGIKVDAQVATGIIKARSLEKAAPRELNIQRVTVVATSLSFPEKEIE